MENKNLNSGGTLREPLGKVYSYILDELNRKGSLYFILIDPDKQNQNLSKFIRIATDCGVDGFFVGSSLLLSENFNKCVKIVKKNTNKPVIIFPGSIYQLSKYADAVLFLSVLTSTNTEYIVGQQTLASPIIFKYKIEAISTAYLLIESGKMTSAIFVSQSKPIPRDKPDIAIAYSLTAQYFGMKLIYLEAGSGADNSVPIEIIQKIKSFVKIPLIVGGGIRDPETALEKVKAGADIIVTGNILENISGKNAKSLISEFVNAIHQNKK
ncbi:putative glycerol-1-phosphate prenyltransferase [Candidatus Kryptobacter tengchongensis]|uniref:Phosphoglycerol geranylgeranyltransferase n=1 Tax=Kryptobacter tengchongensis TaxID=1643429 RepID=A0A916PI83_KRYT1|nr:geranylgeranylglyceryl/heptaprenylglyceryl phosphate synthase [Candidatus Kryptobacter tengchongensis]CUT00976.1 putative glycerol-1-phosphate prenyltransferase [Candidatus Kryptobacter tengchongensis]CUU04442.1 putative glycerol-1-phosphate prenyltransferase [Candidatus Kryptobacter tengchongensis]